MPQRSTRARQGRQDSTSDNAITVGNRKLDPAKVREAEQLKPQVLSDRLTALETQVASLAETVRTRQLEVVDSAGSVRAVLGGPDGLFGLKIRDAAGDDRIFLHFVEDGQSPGLHLSNREGNVVAALAVIDDERSPGALFELIDGGGVSKFMMAADDDGEVDQVNHWTANLNAHLVELRDHVLRLSNRVKWQADYLAVMAQTTKVTAERAADELSRDIATLRPVTDD